MIYYTSIEQSEKLLELGLSLKSADMFYNEEPDEIYPKDIVDTKYPSIIREEHKHYLEEYGIPCWSLGALLEVMPKIPTVAYDLVLQGIEDAPSYIAFDDYSEYYAIHEDFKGNTPLEAAYNTVCWLLEQGYIKKE